MFSLFIIFAAVAGLTYAGSFFLPATDHRGQPVSHRRNARLGAVLLVIMAVIFLLWSMFTIVSPSKVGVVTTLGKVSDDRLAEGPHFVLPWQSVHEVSLGIDTARATKAEAASKDSQVVHSDLSVNYHVVPGQEVSLYRQLPSLDYENQFVIPAAFEVFKAVLAQFTAEELILQRQTASARIVSELNARLAQYHLKVQTVNLVNFGFSKVYNDAIEAKVVESQRSQAAERQKETARFQAESRVLTARGEADAIKIQAEAIEKAGGKAYLELKAIEKWNGQMPTYMTSGSALPFVNLGAK